MALTKDRHEEAVRLPEAGRAGRLAGPWILVVVIALLLLAYGWTFLRDPSISAPTRDPAWYTWRSNVLMNDEPALVVGDWGPFSMFAGGYRVSVPLYGSVLQRVAGIDLYSFSAFMMVGVPILTGLALGAFSWRRHRDPLLFLLVMLATAALFMTTPYVGYLDNITVLYFLSLILAFFEPGRTSWGARTALFMFGIVAAYTHPTTCVVFGASLMAVFGLRVLTSRFHLAPALKELAPSLMATGFGMIFGLASWLAAPWGVAGSLADAALPPPYTREVFMNRLGGWVSSIQPAITVPLIALAIGWTIWRARRDRAPSDGFGTISAMMLLPLVGLFGWATGAAFPYYRFMNATVALFALAGLGAYVAIRWLWRREGTAKIAGVVAALLVVGSFGYIWVTGRDASRWADPTNQWIDQPTRTALAAARAIVETEPDDAPIVFVVNFGDTYQSYGWSKTFTNVSRTGLPGDAVKRSMTYFGEVGSFLDREPTVFTDDTYNKMSRGFHREVEALRAGYPGEPIVFLIRQFNRRTVNEELLDSGDPSLVSLGSDIAVVTGDGLATPSETGITNALAAEAEVAEFYRNHPGLLGNLGHNVWVVLALALLLVVPGLLAARFFELEGPWLKIALIPGISIGLTVIAGVVVVAVLRGPFSTAAGWATFGLAAAFAAVLRVGREPILRALNAFGGFFNRMFSTFSNADFAALMGVQFLVMAADGLVRGSIAKSIAFGGQEGFDITTVPSADYLLKVVLALYVPYTFLSPFIGVVIDRFERRRVLATSSVVTAVVTTILAAAILIPLGDGTSEGNVGATVGLVLAMLVMQACVRIMLAVKSAALPGVVHGKDLMNGNGLSQAGGALFQVLGAGVAFGAGGALPSWTIVVVGAVALAVSASVALRIRRMEMTPHRTSLAEEAKRVVTDILSGVREVARRPAAALGLSAFQMLRYQFWGFSLGVFALYARSLVESGDVDTVALGIVGGGGFVGGVLGMVLAQRWKDTVAPIRLLLGSMLLLGGSALVFGFWVSLAGFSLLLFCGFFAFFLGKISADTILQQAMPDDFRGRAFALFDIAYNLGFIVPALILVVVWADDRASGVLIASGVVFLVLTALVARWARGIRDQLAPQDDLAADAPEAR
ncbi:MAG TPA: MFS transporter [Actinomycetota bacterium]|nr:MFS transporter [Actinomycetota bacterium]